MKSQILKLDDKIIERFEESEGMFLVKGGVNLTGDIPPINVLCYNKNCKTCQIEPVEK